MSTDKKIVSIQFNDTFYPVIDGVVNTVNNYALELGSCVVAPRQNEPFDDSSLPYTVIRTPAIRTPIADYTLAAPVLDRRLLKKIESLEPDILHAHSPFTLGNLALRVGKELGIPVVATFHSKFYDDVYEITKSRFLAKRITAIIVHFFEKADSVWACSAGTGKVLQSYGFSHEVFTMDNGCSLTMPTDAEICANEAAARHAIDRDKINLIFVGQQTNKKNLPMVVDTLALLAKHSDRFRLISVGTGPELGKVKKQVASLGLEDKVVFTGSVSDKRELCGLYLCSSLLFFPSFYDNTPLVLREAAALSVPALLAKGSNAAETVKDGVNGFTAKASPAALCDRILEIFKDEENVRAVGKKAAETIPVPWSEIARRVNEKYAEIIAKKK